MMILINCTGKFCYRHGNFQNTEAATGGFLKIQIKVSQNLRENTQKVVLKMFGKYPGAHLHQIALLSYKFRETKDWLNPRNE